MVGSSRSSISLPEVKKTMRSVRAFQLGQLPDDRKQRGWSHCAFYAGMMAAYRATGERAYLDSTRRWAERNEWTLGANKQHADSHCVGQVYAELYAETPKARRIEPTRDVMRTIMKDPRPGRVAWDWADALFMAPPVLARLGTVTGETRYFDFLSRRFWDASPPLFDPEYGLYYRDARFVDRETENGRPVFWARGNGWVLAGIVRVLQHLPADHPDRSRFERRFGAMAEAIAVLQRESGFWRPSLLDPADVTTRETSGTGFFCYALAWGINNGHLTAATYEPIVRRAWRALERAVNGQGRLGWVQPPGAQPAPARRSETFPYGSGALLLAGSQMIMMENEDQ
jgi:rhamnogalacturonyl hydrolase YesR